MISKNTYIWASIILLFAMPVVGAPDRFENFADRPDQRAVLVEMARQRAQLEKANARIWARSHGIPMRFDDGHRVVELVALRNGIPIFLSTCNANAAISLGSNQVRETDPFDVDGAGWKVGVWDGGAVRNSHQEFGGRVSIIDGASYANHASHVGGTIGAGGVDAQARGMVPNVQIDSYEWTDDIAEMLATAAALPLESNKVHISNHSYGSIGGWTYLPTANTWSGRAGWHWPPWETWANNAEDTRFGQYDSGATNYDHVVYMAPYYLPFVAAGNDRADNPDPGDDIYYYKQNGPVVGNWRSGSYNNSKHPLGDGVYAGGFDNISAEATAKNIMTVGAVADAISGSSRSVSNATMLSFSSWGPTDDGRIKPDIVANGYELYSAQASADNAYAQTGWSGTSMATPNASGSAMLLIDYFEERFPGQVMRASTLKGLIIHTADDLGRPGPDYEFGWGLMNIRAAADLVRDYADGNVLRMTESVLPSTTNAMDTYSLFINGNEPLRVTICWTDPAGTSTTEKDSRAPVLVNDLDLRISGPDGAYYPYTLSYANPTANAEFGENDTDNVEQVYIVAPVAGTYTISVDYDGSLLGGQQHYSLLVSGISADSDGDGISDVWETLYFGGATNAVATADLDGDGSDNYTEYVAGTLPYDSGSVFGITSYSAPSSNSVPFILYWSTEAGRLYSLEYSENLVDGFLPLPNATNLPYTQNSYTDMVERANQVFYRPRVWRDE